MPSLTLPVVGGLSVVYGLMWITRLLFGGRHEDTKQECLHEETCKAEDERLKREVEMRRRRFKDELSMVMHERESRDQR
jgi:hypothetical protein